MILILHAVNFVFYPSTLANLTLIILFSKMFKFSEIISSISKTIVKENSEYIGICHFEVAASIRSA